MSGLVSGMFAGDKAISTLFCDDIVDVDDLRMDMDYLRIDVDD